jgi:hypothetical protein
MKIPILTSEEKAACLGDPEPAVGDRFPVIGGQGSYHRLPIDELETRWHSTHNVRDLMAWSDAVGAQTTRLLAEIDNLRRRG